MASTTNELSLKSLMHSAKDCKSPIEALVTIYNNASPPIREELNGEVHNLILQAVPNAYMLLSTGPTRLVKDMRSAETCLVAAMGYSVKVSRRGVGHFTATVQSAMTEVAVAVDKATKRVLLEDTACSQRAYHGMLASIAALTAYVADLPLTEDQKKHLSVPTS